MPNTIETLQAEVKQHGKLGESLKLSLQGTLRTELSSHPALKQEMFGENLSNREMGQLLHLFKTADDSLRGNGSLYPASRSVVTRYSTISPEGVYSQVDADIKARIHAVRERLPLMNEEARQEIEQKLSGPEFQQFMRRLDGYGIQARLLDRMLQICGDDEELEPLKAMVGNAREELDNPALLREQAGDFEDTLEAMEIVAGIKPPVAVEEDAPEDDPGLMRQNAPEGKLNVPLRPAIAASRNGFRQVTLYDTEQLMDAVTALEPENWGKAKTRWTLQEPNAAESNYNTSMAAVRSYAIGAGKNIMDEALSKKPDTELNPLDLVMISGVSAREVMEEHMEEAAGVLARRLNETDEPSRKQVQDAYLMLLGNPAYCKDMAQYAIGLGLMNGQNVYVVPVNEYGQTDVENMMQVQTSANSYKPDPSIPEQRPVASLWERFTHWAFGAYKEKFDQITAYDLRQERLAVEKELAEAMAKRETAGMKRGRAEKKANDYKELLPRYEANLKAVYASPSANIQGAQKIPAEIRAGTELANRPLDLQAAGITEEEYTALNIAGAHHIDWSDRIFGTGADRRPGWGNAYITGTEDIIHNRVGVEKKFGPEVMDSIHGHTRQVLALDEKDHSPEAEEQREWLRTAVSSAVRATLNTETGITEKSYAVIKNLVPLKGLVERKPGLLGELPPDVRKGLKALENVDKIVRKAAEAREQLMEDPGLEQTRQIYRDIAAERYINGLFYDNSEKLYAKNLADESSEMAKSARAKVENQERFKELTNKPDKSDKDIAERNRIAMAMGAESITEFGLKLNASAVTPLSKEMQALADPGFVEKLNEGIQNSKLEEEMDKAFIEADSYQQVGYIYSASIGKELDQKTYGALPGPEVLLGGPEAEKAPAQAQPEEEIDTRSSALRAAQERAKEIAGQAEQTVNTKKNVK